MNGEDHATTCPLHEGVVTKDRCNTDRKEKIDKKVFWTIVLITAGIISGQFGFFYNLDSSRAKEAEQQRKEDKADREKMSKEHKEQMGQVLSAVKEVKGEMKNVNNRLQEVQTDGKVLSEKMNGLTDKIGAVEKNLDYKIEQNRESIDRIHKHEKR